MHEKGSWRRKKSNENANKNVTRFGGRREEDPKDRQGRHWGKLRAAWVKSTGPGFHVLCDLGHGSSLP